MKIHNVYEAFVQLETGEYDALSSDIQHAVARIFEKFSIRIGLFSSVANKPYGFINAINGDRVYVAINTRGYNEMHDHDLTWATVAKTEKGYRATSCGTLNSMAEFYIFLDKHSLRNVAEKIAMEKIKEHEENEARWQKFQQEQAAKKEAAIARANELSGGYREVVTYQRSTYGGAFSATYYVERTDMTVDEFKEFIVCLGHKAEAKPCDIPIKPEKVEIRQTSPTSWSYDWTGEWDD